MGYRIINALNDETINDLNTNFGMHLSRDFIKRAEVFISPLTYDKEFMAMKREMEEDDEVIYERNTY